MIKIYADMDNAGNITITPMCDLVRAKIKKHMLEMTGRAYCVHFFNDGFETNQWLENDCPAELVIELEKGNPVEFDADPWVVGNWYGYDLCEAL